MIYLFLAEGFEELEAVTIIDVLRRASIPLKIVGINGKSTVVGCHNIEITADILDRDLDLNSIDMIILPGGIPGVNNLESSSIVRQVLDFCNKNNKTIAAICAAPAVLGHLDILKDKCATCYPGMESELKAANVSQKSVCHCDNVITSQGPGTAIEFALYLVKNIKNQKMADDIKKAMLL